MSITPDEQQFVGIRVAAREAQLPPARIRRYVRAGLVRPSRFDGRAALFSTLELKQLRKIRRLHEHLGLNMAGIEIVLRLLDELESARAGQPAQSRD